MAEKKQFETDSFRLGGSEFSITFIGHGTLMIRFVDTVIHVDPVGREADYALLPKGDVILVTHSHGDHLDPDAIAKIRGPRTTLVTDPESRRQLGEGKALKNGESVEVGGVGIAAVPAYNTSPEKTKFHPKGRDNGYVVTLGGARIYVAGDTEPVPEMSRLAGIDVAFLPMNLPYTMSPEQAAEAARLFRPRVLYPYHFGSTDAARLTALLHDEKDIEVRLRSLA